MSRDIELSNVYPASLSLFLFLRPRLCARLVSSRQCVCTFVSLLFFFIRSQRRFSFSNWFARRVGLFLARSSLFMGSTPCTHHIDTQSRARTRATTGTSREGTIICGCWWKGASGRSGFFVQFLSRLLVVVVVVVWIISGLCAKFHTESTADFINDLFPSKVRSLKRAFNCLFCVW